MGSGAGSLPVAVNGLLYRTSVRKVVSVSVFMKATSAACSAALKSYCPAFPKLFCNCGSKFGCD